MFRPWRRWLAATSPARQMNGTLVCGKKFPRTIQQRQSFISQALRDLLPSPAPLQHLFGWQRLASGEIKHLEEDYKLVEELAAGRFGTVYQAHQVDSPSDQVAVKRIPKVRLRDEYKTQYHDLVNEIKILRQLDHPNVMKMMEVYEDSYNLNIVSELYTGRELFEHIIETGSLTERQASVYIAQILEAVQYCHSKRVVHRDIKPENLIFRDDSPNAPLVLIDFGMSRLVKETDEAMYSNCGSPSYVAPEVILRNYDSKCDTWSVGVLLYVLLSGTVPFNGNTESEILSSVLIGKIDLTSPPWDEVSTSAKDLLSKLLTIDPVHRLSATQALQHPWVQLHNNSVPLEAAWGNMNRFVKQHKLQQAALRILTTHVLKHDTQISAMKEVFHSIDVNNDGRITSSELAAALGDAKLVLHGSDVDNVQGVFEAIDDDGDGLVDIDEFIASVVTRATLMKEAHLHAVFAHFDKDGSGRISREELQEVLGCDNLVEDVLRDADNNGDGEIDMEEFIQALKGQSKV